MFDAGHTHGPTAHFVSDCPLCQAAKEARNRAIAHLAEALYLFNGLRPEGEQPTLRLNLAPIGLAGDDTGLCHSFDITGKQGEILADAIDSMNAYAGAQAMPVSRALPSTAAQFAAEHPDVAGWISDAFEEIFAETDPRVFLNDVFTAPDPERAGLAYEDLPGGSDADGDVL